MRRNDGLALVLNAVASTSTPLRECRC